MTRDTLATATCEMVLLLVVGMYAGTFHKTLQCGPGEYSDLATKHILLLVVSFWCILDDPHEGPSELFLSLWWDDNQVTPQYASYKMTQFLFASVVNSSLTVVICSISWSALNKTVSFAVIDFVSWLVTGDKDNCLLNSKISPGSGTELGHNVRAQCCMHPNAIKATALVSQKSHLTGWW